MMSPLCLYERGIGVLIKEKKNVKHSFIIVGICLTCARAASDSVAKGMFWGYDVPIAGTKFQTPSYFLLVSKCIDFGYF